MNAIRADETWTQRSENEWYSTDSWEIMIRSSSEITMLKQTAESDREISQDLREALEYRKEIQRILSYEYPHREASLIPSKMSVSQLKNTDVLTIGEKIVPLRETPRFAEDPTRLDHLQIGTLIHRILMELNIQQIKDNSVEEDILHQIDLFLHNGLITEHERSYIRTDVLIDFFESTVGTLLRHAESVQKETPFIIRTPAGDVNTAWNDSDEYVLVQGVIDCWFKTEDKKIYLIDYKTDMPLDEKQFERIKQQYASQIEWYDKALKKILGKPADERYICFLNRRENIKVVTDTYDDQAKIF